MTVADFAVEAVSPIDLSVVLAPLYLKRIEQLRTSPTCSRNQSKKLDGKNHVTLMTTALQLVQK
ncbi:MAG: hypothetical protein WA728_33535 [Xanthobacteraceae bacterium]